ncbi:MAG: glycosyltransferase family 39 protein, partial [Acidobacteria bacterium]|nr:glycosyltransferase family 39 protein [Acidobacteriota bacterium]
MSQGSIKLLPFLWTKAEKSLVGILLLSAVLRLFSAFYQGNVVEALPGTHDQISYHTLACRVVDGHGFSFERDWWPATKEGKPTAHWSYLYTLYLAQVYWLFGSSPLAARLVQAIAVGLLHPWLSWRIGKRLMGGRAGLIAALITAVYGYFVYYAGALMTESFYVLAILWSVDIATRLASPDLGVDRRQRAAWILLGLAVGAAILLRQVFLLFAPFLLGWLVCVLRGDPRRHDRRIMVSGLLTACLVIMLTILPWTIRNYLAFGRFVLLNTNAGFAFFWGNHPVHGTTFIPILPDQAPSYGSLIPPGLKALDEASMDRELLRQGIAFVRDDPWRYLLLSLSRMKEYFKFWPSPESSLASNVVRTLSFGLFFPFMILGLALVSLSLLLRRANSIPDLRGSPGEGHLLLFLFISTYTLIHLLTWTLIRYRLPVDSILILYA